MCIYHIHLQYMLDLPPLHIATPVHYADHLSAACRVRILSEEVLIR